jgi:hypothetical protein
MQHKAFRGKRLTGGSVKAVPRPITCFVGQLDKNTTAEELADYLSSVGIQHAVCKELASKDGQVCNTAAFRVSCSLEYQDIFYNESNWPEGAELREWVFRSCDGTN